MRIHALLVHEVISVGIYLFHVIRFTSLGPRKPGKPGVPTVKAVDRTSASVSWAALPIPGEDDDEGPVEKYELEVWSSDEPEWRQIALTAKCQEELKKLNSECTYKFRVRAVNKDGAGEYSGESNELRLLKGVFLKNRLTLNSLYLSSHEIAAVSNSTYHTI